MAFRDEHQATSERARTLKRELERTKEELVKARSDDEEAAALQIRAARLEGELAGIKRGLGPGGTIPDWARLLVTALVGGLIGAGLFAWWAAPSAPDVRERVSNSRAKLARTQSPPEKEPERLPVPDQPPTAEAPTAEAQPVEGTAADVANTLEVTWRATVREAAGSDLAAGAICTLAASISDLRFHNLRSGNHLQLTCGDQALFRWGQPTQNGLRLQRASLYEQRVQSSEAFTYQLVAHDRGIGQGRAHIEVDTPQRRIIVSKADDPAFRVELTVETESDPWFGRPAWGGDGAPLPPITEPVSLRGVVEAADGPRVPAIGSRCRLTVSPAARVDSRNCGATLTCGRQVLYRSTAERCRVREGRPINIRDPAPSTAEHWAGSPAFTADFATGRAELADDAGGTSWSVTIAFEPLPEPATVDD